MAKPDVGDRAPDFELPGTGGRSYRLADYRGSGVVLAFYPGDFTRVCTAQFCEYRDNGERLDALGVEVLGISPQSVDSHERWVQERSLNLPLLADEDLGVCEAYGVLGWSGPFDVLRLGGLAAKANRFVRRSVFVIDAAGVVRYKHVALVGNSYQSVDDLEKAVATIR